MAHSLELRVPFLDRAVVDAPPAHTLWAGRVWSMLLCEVWARLFLDRPPSPVPPAGLADIL